MREREHEKERRSEGKREREKSRQTDRHTDGRTDGQIDKHPRPCPRHPSKLFSFRLGAKVIGGSRLSSHCRSTATAIRTASLAKQSPCASSAQIHLGSDILNFCRCISTGPH